MFASSPHLPVVLLSRLCFPPCPVIIYTFSPHQDVARARFSTRVSAVMRCREISNCGWEISSA
ncbi:hypothetical protein E2C01_069218 [Portunus trituberculatus]|uniref:Uncharacterized protein n=1 Tax=Portunus trituberculatus TaxID=210409 RepID=A0A5B7HPH6_PORTR|nr:hypothetical protein [Portunus trituberculatus]